MADWFLILVTSISFAILLVVSVFFLVHYQHPDDRNEAWFPKLTVLLGLVLAGATVLLLPLDVANSEGYPGCAGYDTQICGGINMVLFWDIFYYSIPAVVFLLIPFMTFYYEADDGMLMAGTAIGAKPNSRLIEAVKYEVAVLIIFGLLFVIGFLFLGESSVRVIEYVGRIEDGEYFATPDGGAGAYFNTTYLANSNMTNAEWALMSSHIIKKIDITIPVSIPTFFAAGMAFLGWSFFAVFGGIGLAALPLDLILAFVHRPKRMDPAEFADAQLSIRQRVNELVDIGQAFKLERDERASSASGSRGGWARGLTQQGRKERAEFNEFKKAVFLLEADVEEFLASSAKYDKYNPLIPWFSLLGGIVAVILSVAWVAHIIIYVMPPKPLFSFLNDYFQWFDKWFPLLGVISVAVFTLYLLLCAVKGCFKFGIRFMWFTIHPMQVNKTYMSSFMFNVGLVLLCALPVVQLCVVAFPEYARYSNVVQVMGVQVMNIRILEWFFKANFFIYGLLGCAAITTFYLFCKPRDDEKNKKKGLFGRLRGRKQK